MRITKRKLRILISEALNEQDAAAVDKALSKLNPEDMTKAELELLSMKIDDMLAQLGENKEMKITKSQLKRIIREERQKILKEQSGRPEGPGYVLKSLAGRSALDGRSYGDKSLEAAMNGDFIDAANSIMDALWVDDPWPEDEEALEDMIKDGAPRTKEELASIGAEWLTKFRQGGWHDHSQPYPEAGLKSLYKRAR